MRGWTAKHLGQINGEIILRNNADNTKTEEGILFSEIKLHSTSGKIGDSEDSFLMYYTKINPYTENFILSATFWCKRESRPLGYQAAYGIMAVDTVATPSAYSRHRNQVLLGDYGGGFDRERILGLRVISGYTDVNAMEYEPVRQCDYSRCFSAPSSPKTPESWISHKMTLIKNNKGFLGLCDGQELSFPGCDCLMQQDQDAIYVGFVAAGQIEVQVKDISFEVLPGQMSRCPEGSIKHCPPDYPFPRQMFEGRTAKRTLEQDEIFVSAEGNCHGQGTRDDPWDLQTALDQAGPRAHILLLDGVYMPKQPYYISNYCKYDAKTFAATIEALHPRKVILDGTHLEKKAPLFVLRGNHWHIKGVCFVNSPLSGIMICGNHNCVENCEASHNGDTGILICAYPGVDVRNYPSYNLVKDCDSFENCDNAHCNADGFGAKLRIGSGNRFYRCISCHNVDDGFDLYNKSMIGPGGAVTLEQCVAYENGFLPDKGFHRCAHGFKLGGENQNVAHEARHCLAYGNEGYGFSSNSNPSCRIHFCTSMRNGRYINVRQFSFSSLKKGEWIRERIYPHRIISYPLLFFNRDHTHIPTRNPDGSIDMHGLYTPRWTPFGKIGADVTHGAHSDGTPKNKSGGYFHE